MAKGNVRNREIALIIEMEYGGFDARTINEAAKTSGEEAAG